MKLRRRHIPALITVGAAIILGAIVMTTQRGKRPEKATMIPVEQKDLVRITVEWDPGRDAEWEKEDKKRDEEAKSSESPESEVDSAESTEDDEAESDPWDLDDTESAEPESEPSTQPRRTAVRKVTEGEDEYWVMDEPLGGVRVDPTRMDSILSRLSFLQSSREVPYERGETPVPSDYGLDRPMARITCVNKSGRSYTVLIGRKHWISTYERFAMVEGRPGILVIPASVVTDVTKEPDELRDKRLFTLASDNVKLIQVVRNAVPAKADAAAEDQAESAETESDEPAEEAESAESEHGLGESKSAKLGSLTLKRFEPEGRDDDPRWEIEGEVTTPGDPNSCRNFASDLTAKRVDRVVRDNVSPELLRQYGLSSPSQVYTITGRKKTKDGKREFRTDTTETLYVGGKDADGNYYIRLDWRPNEVGILKAADFDALQKGVEDLREKALHRVKRDEVKTIETVRGGFLTKLEKDRKKDQWILADGQKTKEFAASSLASSILNLDAREFVADSAADLAQYGLDAPAATVIITPRSGRPVKILFGSNVEDDSTLVYAMVEGRDAIYAVDAYKLDAIPEKLSDIADVPEPPGTAPAESEIESEAAESDWES